MNPDDPRDDDTADLPRHRDAPWPGAQPWSGPDAAPRAGGPRPADGFRGSAIGPGHRRADGRDGPYGDGPYGESRYADQDAPRRPWRTVLAVSVAGLVVLGLGATGWALVRPSAGPGPDTAAGTTLPDDPLSTSAVPTTAPPTTPVPTTTAPKPTPTKAKPRPTPTRKPPKSQLPPPPPKPQPGCTPKDPGPDAPHDQVASALAAAGAQHYWDGVVPPDADTRPGAVSVPTDLMYAVAWTESSWRSTVIACDGGVGLMQVMPDTLTYINGRFGSDFDRQTLTGNVQAGAEYLEWLTVYFGHYYFGINDFTGNELMTVSGPVGTGGTTLSLLDVVVAAYNVGPGNVEDTHGTADGSDDTLSIPNPGYVSSVHTNLTACPCQS